MKRVMVVAGEASGDLHASEMIRCLLCLEPGAHVFGVGGNKLRSVGVELVGDILDLAVIGIWDVIGRLGLFVRLLLRLRKAMREKKPDLVILIDFPDFNLIVARLAKQMGIRVFYYISPQIWAWRRGRVRKIARLVDRMAVVFPFEVPWYEEAGVKVDFVGHPLLDLARATRDREETLKLYGLDPGKTTVALLPGSRKRELSSHFAPLLDAGKILQAKGCQLIVLVAHTLELPQVEGMLALSRSVAQIVQGDVYNVLWASDVVIVASGTATLETALMGRPMVIVYKLGSFNYWVARRLVRVPSIGLVNIVAGERIVPELIQNEVEGGNIALAALRILNDQPYRERMMQNLRRVRGLLGSGGASEKAARIAWDLLH